MVRVGFRVGLGDNGAEMERVNKLVYWHKPYILVFVSTFKLRFQVHASVSKVRQSAIAKGFVQHNCSVVQCPRTPVRD